MNKYVTKNAHTHELIGRRVQVVAPGHYGERVMRQIGVVQAVWGVGASGIAVKLDDISNPGSGYGYFYFSISEIKVITDTEEKGENNMAKINNYHNIAEIQFLKDDVAFRTFEYANFDPDLQVGDLCVVQSASHGMGLAEVVNIKPRPELGKELSREIVAKVDTSEYTARVEQRKKAAELKVKMQERAKQLQDIVLYQTLAKEDPEMAELLEKFKALN